VSSRFLGEGPPAFPRFLATHLSSARRERTCACRSEGEREGGKEGGKEGVGGWEWLVFEGEVTSPSLASSPCKSVCVQV